MPPHTSALPANANPAAVSLAVSVVVFHPERSWLEATLSSLAEALSFARAAGVLDAATVTLVDNAAATATSEYADMLPSRFPADADWVQTRVLAGHGNVGYGVANNLAFAQTPGANFLLVLNPDVELDPAAITNGVRHLDAHANCAMVTPVATDAAGGPLYLAKTAPRVSTLALRGFAPTWVCSRFATRLASYERRETGWDAALDDVKFASGCFMLMRRDAFDRAGGFDQSFFLYFEDFDLSARISRQSRIARVAGCRIVHGGGGAGSKGLGHTRMFIASAVRFFAKHGWRW